MQHRSHYYFTFHVIAKNKSLKQYVYGKLVTQYLQYAL